MMQFMLCHNDTVKVGGKELLQQWQDKPDSWIWVELFEEPAIDEQQFLQQQFSLDSIAINEAQRERHPPNFQRFEKYIYLLLKPLDAESKSLDFQTLQLAMFASERFLVTRHTKKSPYLEKLWNNLAENGSAGESPTSIVSKMCKRVAERYGTVLLDLEQRLDIIEDELFDSPTDGLMKELVGYNTSLRKMHRILSYYVDVFGTLRQQLHDAKHNQYDDFDDIYARIERFSSLAALYQSVITDLVDAYISLNGHKLNQIMKVLTIVTVIFVPLSLLVGIYGMNFEYMPELKNENGYYILLSVMSSIAAISMFVFRKKRWL